MGAGVGGNRGENRLDSTWPSTCVLEAVLLQVVADIPCVWTFWRHWSCIQLFIPTLLDATYVQTNRVAPGTFNGPV